LPLHRLGPRRFSEFHGLDIPALVARLNAKPIVRVESGAFVTALEGENLVLGPIQMGISRALHRASAVREVFYCGS